MVESGLRVVMLDRDKEALDRAEVKYGEYVIPCAVDLADAGSIQSAIGSVLSKYPTIDILVNNAGILSNNKFASTSLDEWRRVHAVNVDAAFLLSQAVLPSMAAQRWGRIINISSYAAKSGGLTAGTAYAVSKSAMIGLTFSTAREFAGYGITANAVAPAYVMSPMVSEQLTEEQRQRQLAQIPVGRFCTAQEVAHAVMFLASPLAGFITGEVIDMNGGLHFD